MKNHIILRIISIIIAIIFITLFWITSRDLFRVLLAIGVTIFLIIKLGKKK